MLLRLLRLISIVLSLLLSLSSCKSRQQALMGQVNSLIGKQLTFPEEMLFLMMQVIREKLYFKMPGTRY